MSPPHHRAPQATELAVPAPAGSNSCRFMGAAAKEHARKVEFPFIAVCHPHGPLVVTVLSVLPPLLLSRIMAVLGSEAGGGGGGNCCSNLC